MSQQDGSNRVHSIILVKANISTDTYTFLNVLCLDMIAICFTRTDGYLTIFNIYNNCTNNGSLEALSTFLSSSLNLACSEANNYMLWIGNFNQHHPFW
ncbi:hypothetical protein J132_03728 [Termitomyces sp. J132]|nr:hypothetical protein J132_03728 [Termitomyces sp. J132]